MAAKRWMVIGVAAALVTTTAARVDAQFEQGSTRNLSGISASITQTDGVPGFISASTMRPFVTGLVPVVGDYGGAFAPVYGPAALMPQYNPGPSVMQHRLARMRHEGISLVPRRADVRRNASSASVDDRKPGDFQSRFATARESSAGRAVESIAAIRSRQARERVDREREIAELRRKMELAHTAGKPELARIYHQQIEQTGGNPGTLSGSPGQSR